MVSSGFRADVPPLSTKPLKVKVTINRNMNDMKVKQRSLHSDWFSSIQLTLMGGTAAVKANQLPWNPASFTATYVLNRYVPIYLSYTDIPKSCCIYISCLSFNVYYQVHITFLSDAEHLSCLGRQTLSSALTFSQDHLKLEAFLSVFVASCLSIDFPPTVCMILFINAESKGFLSGCLKINGLAAWSWIRQRGWVDGLGCRERWIPRLDSDANIFFCFNGLSCWDDGGRAYTLWNPSIFSHD